MNTAVDAAGHRPPWGPEGPPSTLLVEDDAVTRGWLRQAVLAAYPWTRLAEAATLTSARESVRRGLPALALIDLHLPDGSGVTLIEELARQPAPPLLVVATVFADDRHLFPALRAGANGYVLKDSTIEQIAALLRGLSEGGAALSTSIAQRLVGWFHAPARPAAVALSQREEDLLVQLARGLTIGEAARALGVTPATAASYAKTLYRKLDVTSRAEATLEAARRGLLGG